LKMLIILLCLKHVISQNVAAQACAACDYAFNWHSVCENFASHSNEDGYVLINDSEIHGLNKNMREDMRARLLENHQIELNTTVKLFNSYTKMLAGTRSYMYMSSENSVVLPPLCDLAAAIITGSAQREQCTVCASITDYSHVEFENACCIDFSIPFFYSPVTILYRMDMFNQKSTSLLTIALHPDLLEAYCVMIVLIMTYAMLIGITNRDVFEDKAKQPGARCLRLSSISIWFAVVTWSTVGYGDYLVKHRCSKIITIVFMFISMVLTSYFVGVIMGVVSSRGKSYDGLEEPSQISGKNICIPGYYYSLFEDMVRDQGGTVTYMESFDECTFCLEDRNNYLCHGNLVAGVLYDYPIIAAFLYNHTGWEDNVAVSQLGVFPYCADCVWEHTFHWAIPDRRYINESYTLESVVYDTIFDEFSSYVDSEDFTQLLPEFELMGEYSVIDPLFQVESGLGFFDLWFLVQSVILVAFGVVVFSLGSVCTDHVEDREGDESDIERGESYMGNFQLEMAKTLSFRVENT